MAANNLKTDHHQDDLLRRKDDLPRQKDVLLRRKDDLLRRKDDLLRRKDDLLRRKDDLLRRKDDLLRRKDDHLSQNGISFCPAIGHLEVLGIQKRQKTMVFAIFERNRTPRPAQPKFERSSGSNLTRLVPVVAENSPAFQGWVETSPRNYLVPQGTADGSFRPCGTGGVSELRTQP